MEKYDVVVIGAGNSGIYAAAALAKSGIKTLLVESHNLCGGCATSFVRGRFEFDVSLHGMDHETIESVRRVVGLNNKLPLYPPQFEFVSVQDGKIHRDFYDHSKDLAAQVEAYYPGLGKSFKEVEQRILDIKAGFVELGNASSKLKMASTMIKHKNVLLNGFKSTQEFYDKYKVPAYVRSFLTKYWWYNGVRLTDVPEFLNCMVCDFDGPHAYIQDTAHSYMAYLERFIREHGGTVLLNTSATEILTKENSVIGIQTDQGDQIEAKHVICAMDPRIGVGKLLQGQDTFKKEIMQEEEKIQENFSFFMIYLGLDCSAEELGLKAPHIVINEDLDPNVLWDHMKDLDGPKTIGVMCPNLTVKDASQEGTCIVSLSVPVQGSVLENLSQKEYVKVKHEFTKRIIEKTEKYLNIDLKSHIEEMDVATPSTFARYASMYNGGLGNYMSLEQSKKIQSLTKKLNQSIDGLSFIGQFAGNLGYANMESGYKFGLEIAKKVKGGK